MKPVQYIKITVILLLGVSFFAQMTLGEEPDSMIPNDPLFPLQWYLHNTGQYGVMPGVDINAIKAWEITTGDPNIVVAVVGEGMDLDHPDLVNNLVPGWDFWDNDDSPYPGVAYNSAFETMTAGLIAGDGNNGIGVTGVTWDCKIMPVRIFNQISQWGAEGISDVNGAAAFRWAATQGADILVYGWLDKTAPEAVIRSALTDITRPGGIGRDGKGCLFVTEAHAPSAGYIYYGIYPETISVAYIDPCDHLWWPHDAGSRVDLVAPVGCPPELAGTSAIPMWATDITGSQGLNAYSNTDISLLDYSDKAWSPASLVGGVAALMLSVEPNLTSNEVRHYLFRSAHDLGEPGRDDIYGWGRVDARAALDMVLAKRCDLNNNWKVDMDDLLILIEYWETNEPSVDIAPAAKRDGFVDYQDIELMMQYWNTEIPEVGIAANWKLDEANGVTVSECINYKDGTLYSEPVWQPEGGMIDGALEFDGIDDYVSTPFILNPADGPFSVFVWVKGGVPGQVILSQIGNKNLLSADALEGNLMVCLNGGRGKELVSQTVVTDDNWHHVGLVWDGFRRTLYVDDVIAAKDSSIQSTLFGSINGFYIGAGKVKESGSFWTGLIDDVKVYNCAVYP
jgi:hypothetical protein